jgi:hypothetical protein
MDRYYAPTHRWGPRIQTTPFETKPLLRLVFVIVIIAVICFKWTRLSRTPAIVTTDRTPNTGQRAGEVGIWPWPGSVWQQTVELAVAVDELGSLAGQQSTLSLSQ